VSWRRKEETGENRWREISLLVGRMSPTLSTKLGSEVLENNMAFKCSSFLIQFCPNILLLLDVLLFVQNL
jgi:hypothetical protein